MLIAVTLCHCLDCSDERNDTDERNDKRDRELEEGTSVSQESRVKIHNKNKRAAGCDGSPNNGFSRRRVRKRLDSPPQQDGAGANKNRGND
jgi:hypothetical protein